ncbi:MAG: group II intron reverse transcriptase/maturase, partial [bacterium]
MTGPSCPATISTKLHQVAELSRAHPGMVWTTLAHHIDVDFLRWSYRCIRKTGAAGVDGVTAADYASKLEENLTSLHRRFKQGTYRAPPVRRVYIPKGKGQQRPLGIPTLEDKILQHAVATVLNAVYEQDFRSCSYGFRPGRSAHQALQALRDGVMATWGGWVVDLDIATFFDTLDHATLRSLLDRRIRDGVIRRVIGKWLNAGVMENGNVHRETRGSPQGGVISPLLANIYLHYALDLWFEGEVRPRLRGRATLVRYADDAVMVFESEAEARQVFAGLPGRLAEFGLRLHPEKTRLIPFRQPPPVGPPKGRGPGSFDFLGLTHFWGRSLRGFFVVQRRTSKKSFQRALRSIWEWCRLHRHDPVSTQCGALGVKLHGHFRYFGIAGNWRQLSNFAQQVRRA